MTDPQWLMQAWEEIRSNKGSMTAGIAHVIAVDIDPERIRRLVRTTKNRSIPAKAGTTCIHRKRQRQDATVRHPTLKDRIVQQALRMLMDPILEADFYTCSHGFRRNRSTHTALRDVARMYPRTTWTIEAESWVASTTSLMGSS